MTTQFEFDVLLSFAGTEREYARAIHDIAAANGLRVFLDEEFQHEIWGKNLVEYLDETYRNRGLYVVALLSTTYRERAYARVERRAAFDRMIEQAAEYFLPVKTDDAWVEGLPKATAYLDLRVHGVIGICEQLVRKVLGTQGKLTIPPAVRVPRVPMGRVPAEQLSRYLLELSSRNNVVAFGALVYNERSAELRKLLLDRIYWDALDMASGPHFEVFAIRDTEAYDPGPMVIEMMTAASIGRSRDRGFYFSTLLKEYFDEEKTRMAYPSFLLFITEHGRIKYCRLIPFPSKPLADTFNYLANLLTSIATGIEEAGGPEVASDTLWNQLKKRLLDEDYTLYIQHAPSNTRDAVEKLLAYVE